MAVDLAKPSMTDRVYLALKAQILNDDLKPGDRLVEMTIAKEQEVSRTPVREALRQLEQEHLVSTFPRKGSIVSKISLSCALDMAKVCTALGILSLLTMIEEGNQKAMAQLEHQLEAMERFATRNDTDGFVKAYRKWQAVIARATSNTSLQEHLTEGYQYLFRLVPLMFASEGRLEASLNEFMAIHRAVQCEDESAVIEAMRFHLKQCWLSVSQNVDFHNFKR